MNLVYRLTTVGLKEAIVLENAQAPSSYSFLLHPASGQQLTAKNQPDGSWAFLNSDGSTAFRLAAPAVSESANPYTPPQCTFPVVGAPPVCTGGPADGKTVPAPPTPTAGIGADDGSERPSLLPAKERFRSARAKATSR